MTASGSRADATTRATVERYVSHGALIFGALGAGVGLVIGLFAHPATAWFAAFELGFPSAILGIIVSAIAGGIAAALHRAHT